MTQAPNDLKAQKLARRLIRLVERSNIAEFKSEVHKTPSRQMISACRRAKIVVRAGDSVREEAAEILIAVGRECLEASEAAEFERYTRLSLAVREVRERIAGSLGNEIARLPKLSKRQLVAVAMRSFGKAVPDRPELLKDDLSPETVAENERRLHAVSGYSNDLAFAVARVLNEAWSRSGDTDLKRPDAMARARKPFREATLLASQLTALDYAFDSASFGDFLVAAHDSNAGTFRLDIADMRLSLIRMFALRRRMTAIMTGHRKERYLREVLSDSGAGIVNNALVRALIRAGKGPPSENDIELLDRVLDRLLLDIGANDDLTLVASNGDRMVQMLYHMSIALRINQAALKLVAQQLGPRARQSFDARIRFDELAADLCDPEFVQPAREAWDLLTIDMPAQSYWNLLKTPFARTGDGLATSLMFSDADHWTSQVRSLLLKGGETGRHFGDIWEDFLACGFGESGWQTVGRNIKIAVDGAPITEVDLLLFRGDLLLVIEIKALTGTGTNPYDHWKNREKIERGCRQAKLAAGHLIANRGLLASIANRRVAEAVDHVQPLVLTNEAMFDGWEHDGVPVAGETMRKAITQGTKVEYYYGHTREVYRTDWHLKPEELNTSTILKALRNPIDLQLGPERGDTVHHQIELPSLTLLVPKLVKS